MLQAPRKLDASMAAADDDPAVTPIVEGNDGGKSGDDDGKSGDDGGDKGGAGGEGGRARSHSRSRSASPTPPPKGTQSTETLASQLAQMVARGEKIPTLEDDDFLLDAGKEREGEGNLNAVAVAQGEKRGRMKQEATTRKDSTTRKAPRRPGSESDSDLLPGASKSRKSGSGGRAGEAGSSKASPAAGKASARGKGKSVDLVSSDSEDDKEQKDGSRHLSVQVSQIYKDWAGIALDATRRRFQTMMMVRDGYPLKTQTPYKVLNYKLVLRAASAVMSAKDAAQFIAQMERAFKDTDKA